MERKKLPYRVEELSAAEKSTLKKRFIGVFIVGLFMGSFILFIMSFFHRDGSFGAIPVIFEIFFFGILIFIVAVHGSNAFQKTKKVYTGIITDKYSQASKSRNSSSNITYFVQLDDVEFSIDGMVYDRCHKGDKVELYQLKSGNIFDAKTLEKAAILESHESAQETKTQRIEKPEVERPRNYIHQEVTFYPASDDKMTQDEVKIIKGKFIRALIFRTVLGFFAGYILFFIIFIVALLVFDKVSSMLYVVWIIIAFVSFVYLWLNRRTYLLFRDLMEKRVIYETEKVVDVERSNMPKPSKHSIVTYQGYTYRMDLFFYVQTEKHWTQITQELYETLHTGEAIRFKSAKYSKLVFDIKKMN